MVITLFKFFPNSFYLFMDFSINMFMPLWTQDVIVGVLSSGIIAFRPEKYKNYFFNNPLFQALIQALGQLNKAKEVFEGKVVDEKNVKKAHEELIKLMKKEQTLNIEEVFAKTFEKNKNVFTVFVILPKGFEREYGRINKKLWESLPNKIFSKIKNKVYLSFSTQIDKNLNNKIEETLSSFSENIVLER